MPSMLYVATTSRPDICFAVGILCRCLANPSARHLEAADTLLAYLMDSKDLGVKYGHNSSKAGLSVIYSSLKEGLYAMSDSDWSSGKSISGYVLHSQVDPSFGAPRSNQSPLYRLQRRNTIQPVLVGSRL